MFKTYGKESKESVLQAIRKFGSKSAPVTRRALCMGTGLTDRAVRRIIESLRREGYRICGTCNLSGYYMARSQNQYEEFRAEYTKKADEIYKTVAKMDRRA